MTVERRARRHGASANRPAASSRFFWFPAGTVRAIPAGFNSGKRNVEKIKCRKRREITELICGAFLYNRSESGFAVAPAPLPGPCRRRREAMFFQTRP